MKELLTALGPIGSVVVAALAILLGSGFITKFKNKGALKDNKEGNEEVAKKEKELTVNETLLLIEQEERARAKRDLEKETGREVTDEELNDFFDKRYPKH